MSIFPAVMRTITVLAILLLLISCEPVLPSADITLRTFTPYLLRGPSPNIPSSHILPLSRSHKRTSRSSTYLKTLQQSSSTPANSTTDIAPLTSSYNGQEYLVNLTISSQLYSLILDTGSSDTWLASRSVTCLDLTTTQPLPRSQCGFGPTYTPPTLSAFQKIAGENFNIIYGGGEFLTGIFGYASVTVAGVTVNKQQIALATAAAWAGDGVSSGLVGLAYPSLTSAFGGSNPALDSAGNQDIYSPLFTTMVSQELVSPIFSLALGRVAEEGYLALGGLPPVATTGLFGIAPIQVLALEGFGITDAYSFYAIGVDSFILDNKTIIFPDAAFITASHGEQNREGKNSGSQGLQVIIDSGTTLIYLPGFLSDVINAAFDPPVLYDQEAGSYVTDCGAAVPTLGVTIGGVTFIVDPEDMVFEQDGTCYSGVQWGAGGPFVLGDVFLRGVVSVFDVGAGEMRFVQRA